MASLDLDVLDTRLLPAPYGLKNTGVICYFNSLLQALASCSAVSRAAADNRAYLGRTRTGRALHDYLWAVAPPAGRARWPGGPYAGRAACANVEALSERLLTALVADLDQRGSVRTFGSGQQSASEALVLLLEMTDAPLLPGETPRENPISRLFYHRYRAEIHCCDCHAVSSEPQLDVGIQFGYFHHGSIGPTTPDEFADGLRQYATQLTGFSCEKCRSSKVCRIYILTMVPEIVAVTFNVYDPPRRYYYFPQGFAVPAAGGGALTFAEVAQVQHFGNCNGGHYTARGLRQVNGGASVFELNDESVKAASFGPADGVYLVFYHATASG